MQHVSRQPLCRNKRGITCYFFSLCQGYINKLIQIFSVDILVVNAVIRLILLSPTLVLYCSDIMNGLGVSESVIFNIHNQEMGVYIYFKKAGGLCNDINT